MRYDEDTLKRAHLHALEQLVASHGGVLVRPERRRWKAVLESRRPGASDAEALGWMSPTAVPRLPFEGLLSPSYHLGAGIARGFDALWRWGAALSRIVWTRYQIARTEAVLNGMSDRTLKDIGLSRAEVHRAARDAVLKRARAPAHDLR